MTNNTTELTADEVTALLAFASRIEDAEESPIPVGVSAAHVIRKAIALLTSPRAAASGQGWREGVNAVAKMLEKKADDYANEFGSVDPDTNALEFGTGAHAEAKREYHWSLVELIEEVQAMLDAAPAAPVAEPANVDLALIVAALEHSKPTHDHYPEARERHRKALESARMLVAGDQAVAADGAATDQWVAKAQSEFVSALILAICELPDRSSPEGEPGAMVANIDEIAYCVDVALEKTGLSISRRAAVSPATAESNCTCGMKLGHARHCAAFDESMVRYEPFGEKTATADERAAHLDLLQDVLDAKEVMLKAGCAQAAFAEMFAAYSARASQAAAPADAREPHADDVAVDEFAIEMKAKMAAARAKGRSGWETCAPADLSRMLREHVEKGDPRDVANFCMMLYHHRAPISRPADAGDAREPSAWVTPEGDRAITQSQKQGMLRDGGAGASSVRPFSIACYAGRVPADAGEAVAPSADLIARCRELLELSDHGESEQTALRALANAYRRDISPHDRRAMATSHTHLEAVKFVLDAAAQGAQGGKGGDRG
ncbi:hypothetical protein [Burkholderia gladioli]|uniref:hypothetical protein n=1 Tax=Burkholderia gladioli TaxID=28095 RepID=UPI001641CF4C|nr:hypothetical protein [Burkholderia gladioli]